MSERDRFAMLGSPRRIFAISAVHGEVARLAALHADLLPRFRPGDRLIYLGNLIGHGARVHETLNELLNFRRMIIALPGVLADDIAYLRGSQEEMWQKLLQLQFAADPVDVLSFVLRQGLEPVLLAYGSNARDAMTAARYGAMPLARLTNQLRARMRGYPGHENLFGALRRAAYSLPRGTPRPRSDCSGGKTVPPGETGLLFVNAGLDPTRPLNTQGDAFWWSNGAFDQLKVQYSSFLRVFRGYDPGHGGLKADGYAVTLDGGSGFGGVLTCTLIAAEGEILDIAEA